MDAELLVQRIANKISPEPIRQIFEKQVLAKVLTPGTILRPSLRERKQKLEGEVRRLASTAAETGPSAFLVEAIHECEQQLRQITDQLRRPSGIQS
jgi:hypothetical protein